MPVDITDKWLKDEVPPAERDATFWDAELTGFGVRIFAPTKRRPKGMRSFFLNYRVNGREKRLTIGSYPEWTAKAAREEAKRLRREVDRGSDPATERRERREAPTVKQRAERYEIEHLPSEAPSSQGNDKRMIEKYILPALGDRA